MKKFFSLFIALFFIQPHSACAGDGYYYTYSLFTQEIISSPRYAPFLLEYNAPYYSSLYLESEKNENIEEWQKYLNISYEDAYYLVMKAPRRDIQNLIKGNKISNDTLSFATSSFVKNQVQALKYISYSKYLEPFMVIQVSDNNEYWWYNKPLKTVSDLDYNKVVAVLVNSWNAEKDKELKLRYGYQLVRFAHYNREYESAIDFFSKYVESLNYRSVMYYYALNQKAGAERGMGNITQANYDFIKVFTHTKNLQENVYNSIKLSSGYDLSELLSRVTSKEEQNDIYLLLGFQDFSNPLSTIEKIIKNNPDAVQAKVLMARAVKQISDAYILDYYPDNGQKDKRIPFLPTSNEGLEGIYYEQKTLERIPAYLKEAENLAIKMAGMKEVKNKDYWNITLAYLYFLEKEYTKAKNSLEQVKSTEQIYVDQKFKLQLLLEVSEQSVITPEFEVQLYSKYKDMFNENKYSENLGYEYMNTFDFVIDILSNRYFIQGDYAKSFLLENEVDKILGIDFKLLDDIEAFYHKKNKNSFEQYLYRKSIPSRYSEKEEKYVKITEFNFDSYIAQVRGIQYFQKGDFQKAWEYFKLGEEVNEATKQANSLYFNYVYYQTSDSYFGYNKIECFRCKEAEVIGLDYIDEFPFIKKKMNFRETTEAILSLQKIAVGKSEKAARANYLLGNYFYNTGSLGYYRGCLLNYSLSMDSYLKGKVYFKYNYAYDYQRFNAYSIRYPYDDFNFPDQYLLKSLELTKDKELKARAAFALSKTEQGKHYQGIKDPGYYGYYNNKGENILIKDRKYFKELQGYKDTSFYKEVAQNCKYFDYYITHYTSVN